MYTTVEVDFDVFKALTIRRTSEIVTCNDVLRELLDLPPAENTAKEQGPVDRGDGWRGKGVLLPNGTDIRAKYKGEVHTGKVENGALVVNSKRYGTPSAAASSITGGSINGWNFWQANLPGQSGWRVIASFRD